MKPKYSLGERITLKPSAYGFSALRKIEKTSIGLVVRRIEICEKHDNSKACAICNKIAYRFVGDNESNEGGAADWSWCLVEK